MKKNFSKLLLGGALLCGLSISLTSCEDILGHWERPASNTGTPGGGDGGGSSAVSVTNIKLSQSMKVIKWGGDAFTITATVTPSDATITWESSKEAVATVDATGKVTPVSKGIATITAKSGDATASCKIFVGNEVDLSTVANYEVGPYDILKNTLNGSYSITIPNGVIIAFDGMKTTKTITCQGDATIYLTDGSTNTVDVSSTNYAAGIKVGGTGKTLTIDAETAGTGKLDATGGNGPAGGGAGIGTGYASSDNITCGDITINGGTVNANGGYYAAGIGTGNANNTYKNTCGAITINGGTVNAIGGQSGAGIGTGNSQSNNTCDAITINGGKVNATGGDKAAGIGTGFASSFSSQTCGNITIGTGVTSVTATKGYENGTGPNSIGKGGTLGGTQNCGTITIGGEVKDQSEFATGDTYTYTPAP